MDPKVSWKYLEKNAVLQTSYTGICKLTIGLIFLIHTYTTCGLYFCFTHPTTTHKLFRCCVVYVCIVAGRSPVFHSVATNHIIYLVTPRLVSDLLSLLITIYSRETRLQY